MHARRTLLRGGIVLYFVIAFEVLIMISPFAGFFYAIFNPLLRTLAGHTATRWLSAFFLPHMTLPSDPLLVVVRILGSVLFMAGAGVFLLCAARVYFAKFTRRGAVTSGLYAQIRHPQYLALAIAGIGLAILWPRFLTVLLWLLMVFAYLLLARDEERRMLSAHGKQYREYRDRTGMFLPKGIERRLLPATKGGRIVFALGFAGTVIGTAFLLRIYTISHLTLWYQSTNVAAVAILPEDGYKMDHRMPAILDLPEVSARIEPGKTYLVYFLPREYVMQGMIADTGEDWKLYNQHHSFAMIADWIFNPFGHLREGHHAMHHPGAPTGHAGTTAENAVVRRLIFLSAEESSVGRPRDLFAINTLRTPRFMIDVEVHAPALLDARALPQGSGWGMVPTPLF